jgi:hypothetical protein
MVTGSALMKLVFALLAIKESSEPLIERLDPPRRAAVVMAILGLVLTGLVLVTGVMIGGRWVRHLARKDHGRTKQTGHIENQRLRDSLRPALPHGVVGETTIAHPTNDETTADS